MSNFSFTVTLKPCMYRYEPEEQYDLVKNHLYITLKQLSNNFTLVTELTQNMNIHFHGIIELYHKKKWYSVFRKSDKFGFTSCREISDMEGWKKYISKDLQLTLDMLERRPIINDDYKVFTLEDNMKYGTTY